MNILPEKCFKKVFCVDKSYTAVCFNYFSSMAIFGTKIFHKVMYIAVEYLNTTLLQIYY